MEKQFFPPVPAAASLVILVSAIRMSLCRRCEYDRFAIGIGNRVADDHDVVPLNPRKYAVKAVVLGDLLP